MYHGSKRFEEKELIPIVLARAPAEYKCILTSESRSKKSSLTLGNIQDAMIEQYRMGSAASKSTDKSGDSEGELLLYGGDKSKCHICGGQGS